MWKKDLKITNHEIVVQSLTRVHEVKDWEFQLCQNQERLLIKTVLRQGAVVGEGEVCAPRTGLMVSDTETPCKSLRKRQTPKKTSVKHWHRNF